MYLSIISDGGWCVNDTTALHSTGSADNKTRGLSLTKSVSTITGSLVSSSGKK